MKLSWHILPSSKLKGHFLFGVFENIPSSEMDDVLGLMKKQPRNASMRIACYFMTICTEDLAHVCKDMPVERNE